MRSKVVVGNWKLNGSLAGNEALLEALLQGIPRQNPVACAVCVPSPFLAQARALLEGSGIAWGSQDVSRFDRIRDPRNPAILARNGTGIQFMREFPP